MDALAYHSGGVFSNVYKGTLTAPHKMQVWHNDHLYRIQERRRDAQCYRTQIAVKKTWPKKGHRNDEFFFLAGMRRNAPENIIRLMYTFKSVREGVVSTVMLP